MSSGSEPADPGRIARASRAESPDSHLAMSRTLLRLSDERIEAELRKVRQANEDEAVYLRRRNAFAALGVLLWCAGVVIGGGAFHTTNPEIASVLLLLSPIVGTGGPLALVYVFRVTGGEI